MVQQIASYVASGRDGDDGGWCRSKNGDLRIDALQAKEGILESGGAKADKLMRMLANLSFGKRNESRFLVFRITSIL